MAGQTPCDVAWEAKQLIIAKQLESKMVFGVSVCRHYITDYAHTPSQGSHDNNEAAVEQRTRINVSLCVWLSVTPLLFTHPHSRSMTLMHFVT